MECHSTYIEYIVFYTYLMELKDIGLNLAKARMQANMSAYELSLRIGRHTSYINKVECGKINISLKSILQICEALKIEPIDLFKSE